ncbi:MAG: hypothetical protein ACOX5J_16300 [Candidatus Hydrogenedentales bacterium]
MIIGHLIPAGTGSRHYQNAQAVVMEDAEADYAEELEVGPGSPEAGLEEAEDALA